MKLKRFIELLQEDDMNPDWEVNSGISIDTEKGTVRFPDGENSKDYLKD